MGFKSYSSVETANTSVGSNHLITSKSGFFTKPTSVTPSYLAGSGLALVGIPTRSNSNTSMISVKATVVDTIRCSLASSPTAVVEFCSEEQPTSKLSDKGMHSHNAYHLFFIIDPTLQSQYSFDSDPSSLLLRAVRR